MPLDKSKLGNRYVCFSCGCKFYDLNRPVATCPECGTDQAEAPDQDMKALIAKGKKNRKAKAKDPDDLDLIDEGDDDDDDNGLFDDADDDDDGDDDDDDDDGDDDDDE